MRKKVLSMKYIFFDIDGTLVDYQLGIIPSTQETIKQLQEQGHFVAIASGRNINSIIPVANLLHIDNIVSDGGNGLMYKGRLLHIDPIPSDIKNQLSQELINRHIPFAYMTDSHLQSVKATQQMLNGRLDVDFENLELIIDDTLNYRDTDAFKIFMELYKGDEDLIESINVHKIMRYFDNCLAYEPDDKYKGVKELVELDGGSLDDIIFFGDGLNDIDIAQKAPVSIAMGNAVKELKEVASFITKDCQDDGIAYACQYLKLI
jgi:hypothetical protein